jgi:hypothetical protein
MPIKPENKRLYPREWDDISRAAKEAADWKCQHPGCTARQYDVGYWVGEVWNWSGRFPAEFDGAYARAKQYAAEQQFAHTGDVPDPDPKYIVIVLTPTNCAPENLRVACRRHHLRYDAKHHAESSYMTRMGKRNNLELPL